MSFLDLLNTSISASWLVLVVIGLRLLLKKAPKAIHCALWALVAIRLLCPVSIESPVSLMPSTQTVSDYYQTQQAALNSSPAVLDVVENPIYPGDVDISLDLPAHRMEWSLFEWHFIWPAGMAVMAGYALLSWLRIRKKVSASIPIAKHIRICDYISSPFILGVFRPVIYLPSDMDQDTLDHVIAHELAHLARRDHWWKPLGFVLLSIHWFNPILWLAYILLCRDIELACDERVIQDLDPARKKAYSAALLACSVSRPMIAACPLAFGEVGVKERVKNVLNYKKPAFWFVVLAVILCAVVAVCFLTDPITPTVDEILSGDSYTILAQCDETVEITIPVNQLPQEVFTHEGCEFEEGTVIVHRSETSTISLRSARYADETGTRMSFTFSIRHELPKVGTILLPYRLEDGEKTDYATAHSPVTTDSMSIWDGEPKLRNVDDGFTLDIITQHLRGAEEFVSFPVTLNQLTYARHGSEPKLTKPASHQLSDQNKAFHVSSDTAYELGRTKNQQFVFLDPYRAFEAMTRDYSHAIEAIQSAYSLAPLTPLEFEDYKVYGAQLEDENPTITKDCRTVAVFLDYYENSFTDVFFADTTPTLDMPVPGHYKSLEKLHWNWASSYYLETMTMEVREDSVSIQGGDPIPVEWKWQAECPISDAMRKILAELADIDPIFAYDQDLACRYMVIDGSHFLVDHESGLYLVSWRRSTISLEIMNYIFRMVPTDGQPVIADPGNYEIAVMTNEEGAFDLAAIDFDLGDADTMDAIVRFILEYNPEYVSADTFTCVSYQPLGHSLSYADGDGANHLNLMLAVRIASYRESADGSVTETAAKLLPVQLRLDPTDHGTYRLSGYTLTDFNERPYGFILEIQCWMQAVEHFHPDSGAALTELQVKYPKYFKRDTSEGLDLLWWNTDDGVRCVILSGMTRERRASEASYDPPLTVYEAMTILEHYNISPIMICASSSTFLRLQHIEAP